MGRGGERRRSAGSPGDDDASGALRRRAGGLPGEREGEGPRPARRPRRGSGAAGLAGVTVARESHVPGRRAGGLSRDAQRRGGKAMILAGDVGGTKTNLALFRPEGGRLSRGDVRTYPSREHPSLESILKEFLGGRKDVELACI